MSKKLILPTYYPDNEIYIYFNNGEECGKAMYEFHTMRNKIIQFIPLRQFPYYEEFNKPDYTVVLPVDPYVYIPRYTLHKEMEERKAAGEKFFLECGLHANQSYVRNDEGALVIGEGVFKNYKKLTLVHAGKCPLSWEPGAFRKDVKIELVAPEDFELRVVEFSYPVWNENNEKIWEKEYYPLVGDKKIFDEIDGFMSTSKEHYRFVDKGKIQLPNITINEKQYVNGGVIEDVVEKEMGN